MLTFDDGYLDNWVFVWPLLRKYGMRATVFVTADFIEPDGPPRPTLEDVWGGKIRMEELQAAGFLRPSELRIMSESGVIDVQQDVWALVENLAPAYGDHWWFISLLAFVRQDQSRFDEAALLAESALCLVHDDNPPTAGQVTTAQAMGDNLLARLQKAGIRFEVR